MTSDAWWLVESARASIEEQARIVNQSWTNRVVQDVARHSYAIRPFMITQEARLAIRRLRHLGFTVKLSKATRTWEEVVLGVQPYYIMRVTLP